ncbi:AMP-binding protein [Paenibacillus sp. sgz5001063]|uniref:non-ribosomal peptide synthetase n=1 Tax=Paenibacillus sp. sgz5001063 TaxID=3242474 RepID=UPI0036D21408
MNGNTLTEAFINNSVLDHVGVTFIESSQDENFISYRELYGKSLLLLGYLQELGIRPGEELLFQIEDNLHFLSLFWACILGGIIPVPCSLGTTEDYRLKLTHIWNSLSSPHLVVERRISGKLEGFLQLNPFMEDRLIWLEDAMQADIHHNTGVIHEVREQDIAFIQFSSGSTGAPKGVTLTHGNLVANVSGIIHKAAITEKDSYLSWMPLTHDMGLIGMYLAPMYRQINSYLIPTDIFARRPMIWLDKVNKHRVTRTASPNFGYKLLMTAFKPRNATDWDLSCIRTIFNGAEPIAPNLCHRFMDLLENYGLKRTSVFPVYGLAEASVGVSFPPPDTELVTVTVDRRFLAVGEKVRFIPEGEAGMHALALVELGSALNDCEIRISSDSAASLPESSIGYIQIRGKNVTGGYYNNPAATAKLITGDGWVNTGDLGFLQGGNLVVTGRAKDIIFVNGRNAYPHDIERIAEDTEGVELGKVAVAGLYDEVLERDMILVFIQYKKPLAVFAGLAAEVSRQINRRMAIDVDKVIPVKMIPKTTSGKVQRYVLGESYKQGEYSEIIRDLAPLLEQEHHNKEIVLPQTDIEIRLSEIWQDTLGLAQVGIYDHFFEIGGNSMLLLQMIEDIEAEYPGVVSITDPFAYPTIHDLAQYIMKSEASRKPAALELPGLYMADTGMYSAGVKRCVLRYGLTGIQSEHLRQAALGLNAGVDELLLGIYMILLSQVAPDSLQIELHAQLLRNKAEGITLAHSELRDLTIALQAIQLLRRRELPSFRLTDMFNRQQVQSRLFVSPLFLNRETGESTDDLLKGYDLIVEVGSLAAGMEIAFIFNERLLNKEEIRIVFANYIHMLEHAAELSIIHG